MCKGKQCPNFDNCKCNKDEIDYTSEKYKDLIPSTTSPHWKGKDVEEKGSVAQGDVIFNLFIGDEE